MLKNTTIILADLDRYRYPRFDNLATDVSTANVVYIASASSASNRIRRATSTQDRRGVQGVQDQVGQGEAGGKFHSLLGLRKVQSIN